MEALEHHWLQISYYLHIKHTKLTPFSDFLGWHVFSTGFFLKFGICSSISPKTQAAMP